MHLADHIRPLLRDHDCVIIPDFGALVADFAPSRLQPGRHVFSPPTKLVAFNQVLTRNDGLLVDALSQHLGVPAVQAREALRQAVAQLKQDLRDTNRTELPGIGIFRQAAGRGLTFEYTGTDNLLPAAYGLPELAARPIRATDARQSRQTLQPALRLNGGRRKRLTRLLPGAALGLVVGLVLAGNYLFALNAGYLPQSWQAGLSRWKWQQTQSTASIVVPAEAQQAALGQHDLAGPVEASDELTSGYEEVAAQPTNLAAAPVAAPTPVVAEAALVESNTAEPAEAGAPALVESKLKVEAETPIAKAPVMVKVPVAVKPVADKKPVAVVGATLKATVAPKVGPAKAAPAKKDVVTKPVAVANTPAPAAVSAAKVAAPVASTTIKTRTGRFYVVAGAFSSLAGADKYRQELTRKGRPAHVILPPSGSRLYRLSVADFADRASAEQEARRLRAKSHSTNSHIVLNY
jgi:hypothetical protein